MHQWTHTDRHLTTMHTWGHGGSTNGPIYWQSGTDDNYGLHQTAPLTFSYKHCRI